jgi:hypothetical protein
MGKEGIILEHEAKSALVRGNILEGLPIPGDLALIWTLQPGDKCQDGRLSAAARSQQRQHFARSHIEGYVPDRMHIAKRFIYSV